MKSIVFCIQNHMIESVLRKNQIINEESVIIRSNKELKTNFLEKVDPDFVMFPHWSHIVDPTIVDNFNCICFHSTPLPYGRGGSPIQNMIIRGHKETEVCSLLMERDFDSGPIYIRTKISLEGSLDEILTRVYQAISAQIIRIINEDISPVPQKGEPTYFKRKIDNEIDFSESLNDIYNSIRMLDSEIYPNPYTYIKDYKIDFSSANKTGNTIEANITITKSANND